MLRLFDGADPGDAHKLRNMLSLLDVRHQPIEAAGDQVDPREAMLVDGDLTLRGACAILVYLGRKYGCGRWLPVDAAGEACVQEWLAVTTSGLACAELLDRYEQRLTAQPFLVGKLPTIADVAGYAHVRFAPDVDLAAHRAVRDWLARLEQLDGFVPRRAHSDHGSDGQAITRP